MKEKKREKQVIGGGKKRRKRGSKKGSGARREKPQGGRRERKQGRWKRGLREGQDKGNGESSPHSSWLFGPCLWCAGYLALGDTHFALKVT